MDRWLREPQPPQNNLINSTKITKGENHMKNIEILSKVNEVDMRAILEVWESSVRATYSFLNRKKLFTKSISAYILEAIFIKRYVKWPVARQ